MTEIIAAAFLLLGLLFMMIAAFGVLRFPDFFTRLHASGVGETLGALLMTVGMMVLAGPSLMAIKIFIIFVLLLLSNPLGTNLIMMEAVHAKNYEDYNQKCLAEPLEDADAGRDERETVTREEAL